MLSVLHLFCFLETVLECVEISKIWGSDDHSFFFSLTVFIHMHVSLTVFHSYTCIVILIIYYTGFLLVYDCTQY